MSTLTEHRARKTSASNVKAEMARAGVTQSEVAQWLGITQPAVSARLKGRVAFNVDELDVIAERLGLTIAYLVAPPFPAAGGMKEAGRPEGRPAEVAGAGFEPATSGIWATDRITADDIAALIASAEDYANAAVHS